MPVASAAPEMFIVDDDPGVVDALSRLFALEGFRVTGFSDGGAFLGAARSRVPTCVLLDVKLPGRSGLDLLAELDARHYGAPILIMSGEGDIAMAVRAIRDGACDFIEKPLRADAVVGRVRDAVRGWRPAGPPAPGRAEKLLAPLSGREREVLERLLCGRSNKEVGRDLGISPRTAEVHRGRIMAKLGARNAADLVRIVMQARGA